MIDQDKIVLSKKVMQISGIFTLIVAGLLLLNFVQLRSIESLESETLKSLVERLKDDPKNEVMMKEIREFDLVVRKAYFTAQWQVNTGAWLMIIGGVLFALSLKVYTDLRRKINKPEDETEEPLTARIVSMRWLLVSGAVLFSGAIIAAVFSNNYLEKYEIGGENVAVESDNEGIEVVKTFLAAGDSSGSEVEGASAALQSEGAIDGAASGSESQDLSSEGTPGGDAKGDEGLALQNKGAVGDVSSGTEVELASSGDIEEYGIEDFKKNHNSFRGPLGHGVSYHKDIPVSWDGATGTNVKWKVAISKPGYNSPVIWGDKLFLAGGDAESRLVTCYNRNSGQVIWEKEADNIEGSPVTMPKVTDDTGLSAPTMVVDGYRVYAIFATGDVIAFDLDGKRVWARNLGVPRNHYGHSSSLIAWNGKLLIQYDTGKSGRMLALNDKTGETIWDIERDNGISWASPILVEVDGKMQVVTTSDPNVAGYDVETGEEIWKLAVMMGEVGPSCAYGDGLVFANNEYASLVAINPVPGASVQWEQYEFLSEAASPVAYNGLLFLATSYGVVACHDTKTGEAVWEKDFGVTLYSSPMVAEGKLYMIDNNGVMHIIKADRSGELIGEPALGEASYSVPAFADGRIYVRGKESLYCIGE